MQEPDSPHRGASGSQPGSCLRHHEQGGRAQKSFYIQDDAGLTTDTSGDDINSSDSDRDNDNGNDTKRDLQLKDYHKEIGDNARSSKSCGGMVHVQLRQEKQRRHPASRPAYEEGGQCPWSPWSRWRLILKLLYAVVVPAAIIYLLRRFDQSLQSQHRGTIHHSWRPPSSSARSGVGAGGVGVGVGVGGGGGGGRGGSWQQQQQQQRAGGAHLHRHQDCRDSLCVTTESPWGKTLFGTLVRMRSSLSSPRTHPRTTTTHPNYPLGSTMVQQTSFDQFVLFGDSITQYSFDVNERGFGAQLAHLFQRRLDIVNRGFSGYTSEQAIHLLPQLLPRVQQHQHDGQLDSQSSWSGPKVQFLSIFYGANDACLAPSPQHVDMDRYEQNMRALIDMVHHPSSPTYSPETRVIIICPPPIDEARWAVRRKERGLAMDRDQDVTRKYSETCLKVAREYQSKNDQHKQQHHQVELIDTWGLMTAQVESGQRTLDDYLKDGLHLASEGNNLIFEEIMKIVRSRYPEWDPETRPMNGPWWNDLDHENPAKDLLICGNKVKAEP